MKRFLIVFLVLFVLGFGSTYAGLRYFRSYTRQQLSKTLPQTALPSPTTIPTIPQMEQSESNALFVPYWSLSEKNPDFSGYDELIYFGVAADESGLDTTDAGYTALPTFLRLAPPVHTSLALRMVDSSTNVKILANKTDQQEIISQVVALAQKDGFRTVVLDLEVSAIPFDSLIKQITAFNESLGTAVHDGGLTYSVMIYGDALYRARPFDVQAIAKSADQVMVMAYDFSKANGNPGPGFPLAGSSTYGYDYTRMTGDFLDVMPKEKLAVTFGMFGYDWTVDDKQNSSTPATAVTDREAQEQFISHCIGITCAWKKDNASTETQVTYQAKDKTNHIVWFSSTDSAKMKKDYLKQHGVSHFAYWAYSYF